jgi:hypothetical protein
MMDGLGLSVLRKAAKSFEGSDLFIGVEVLDWHRRSPELLDNIRKNYKRIYTLGQYEV